MAQTKSFFDVLEDQIRTDLRREIEAEVRAEMTKSSAPKAKSAIHDRLEAWLLTNVTPASFSRRSGYSTPKPAAPRGSTPPPPVREPLARVRTVEETCALELLLRHAGTKIDGGEFTEAQLKTLWRRAALKSHPDRFTGEEQLVQLQKAALFRELCAAYECLQHLFESRDAA